MPAAAAAHPDERALQTPQRPIWRVCAGVLWHDRRVHVGGADFQRQTARGVARWGKRARRSACVVSRRDWPTAAHGSAQLTRMASTGGVLWVALGGMVHHVVVQKRMVAVAGVRGLHMQMRATRFVPRCMWDREHGAYCSGGLGVVGR